MKLVRGLHNWNTLSNGCVATVGNFDGVHRGHAGIFNSLTDLSNQYGLPSLVISFNPLPHEFFSADARQCRLQTFRDKVQCIATSGVDRFLVQRFDQKFANLEATQYIEKTLLAKLGVRHLLVGDDFQFGKDRKGDINLLEQYIQSDKFSVSQTQTVEDTGERISSTRIREHLRAANCIDANRLLGRPYCISGRVVKGAQLGRTIGFPTANVALKNYRPLLRGVFAVETLWNNRRYPSVANLGERPTVDGKQLLLEVNLLDQQQDLYGEYLQIDFLSHIRNEKKFDSLDQLKAAITRDAETARGFFERRSRR